jgi:hypothetical protein
MSYNGHPSYGHWNAALWFGNDEGLYHLALEARTSDELIRTCRDLNFNDTPDGVYLSDELIAYAWREQQEEE